VFEATRYAPHEVALTFDAGVDDRAVPLLLQTLQARHVHATFFLTGRFCERYPRSVRAIADAGMEIGNHSYSHPHFTKLSRSAILEQLSRSEAAITRACGRGAKPLFRFPFGDCDRRTIRIVAEAGYQPIGWTIDSLDSVGKPKSPQFVADRINRRIRSGEITLCHVSMIRSAKALPAIFAHLDRQGDHVVPVSTLLVAARSAQAPVKLAAQQGE
jgi:peptidoglycan/xylan/chitin deacetylase (PgdA/CDA1 family)